MLLKQIKYFCAIVDEGSFTEAAEKCFISQSAISQQMQSLEKELGVKLMQRENRRFSLTPADEYLYRHGTSLFIDAESICRETRRIGQNNESILKIAYPKSYGSAKVAKLMDEYESCHGFLNMLDASKGLAPGDPSKMAERIIESVDMEKAPLRMVLGSQALSATITRLKERIADYETQKELAASTDIPV